MAVASTCFLMQVSGFVGHQAELGESMLV